MKTLNVRFISEQNLQQLPHLIDFIGAKMLIKFIESYKVESMRTL